LDFLEVHLAVLRKIVTLGLQPFQPESFFFFLIFMIIFSSSSGASNYYKYNSFIIPYIETGQFIISNTNEFVSGNSANISIIIAPTNNGYSINLTSGSITFTNLNFQYGGVADLYVICTMAPSNTSKITFENCKITKYGICLNFLSFYLIYCLTAYWMCRLVYGALVQCTSLANFFKYNFFFFKMINLFNKF
jgi:hypothetical protein